MRSNKQYTRQIQKAVEKVLPLVKKAKNIARLGIEVEQWLACIMICTMLLPVFSLPVRASVYRVNNATSGEFEPVNEQVSGLTETWRNLKAKIESWTTPLRSGNASFGENEEDKKKKNITTNERADKKSFEEKTADNPEPKSSKNVELPSKNAKTEKEKSKLKLVNSKSSNLKNTSTTPVSLLLNQLPVDEQGSRFEPENNLGAPPGQTEMDSSNEATALRIRHRPGAANFSFGLPLASLSGRGIDAGVGLTYNSRTWNKSCSQFDSQGINCVQSHFTYDVEQSWIAPGFSTGFGYLETRARITNMTSGPPNNWYTVIEPVGLTDPDGTRHELTCKTEVIHQPTGRPYCGVFTTTDGSFIEFTGPIPIKNPNNSTNLNLSSYGNLSFATTYRDGTAVYYTGGFGTGDNRRHYPNRIRDRNGNYITIAYKNQTPKIDYINDTLDRRIKFYYENDSVTGAPDKLVTVTIPGMGASEEIQTVRFYYDQMTLQSGGFSSGAAVTAPTMIRVLKYVFMPATKTGYKYDYHPKYGMITKITRQVGMSGSTTDYDTTGTLSEGLFAASTEYNYPDGNTALNDVPKYDKRTDDWQGRPTSIQPQETRYTVPETGDTNSIITVKDNDFDVVTETISYGGGMVKETSTTKRFGPANSEGERPYSQLMSKSEYTWTGINLTELNVTNEVGLTKKTKFTYELQYNNQTKIEEYDFGTANPTLLRTTEIEYETGAGWVNNKLLSLPKSVKTTVGGVVVSKTLYEYDHNGSDTSLVRYSDIINHDNEYNPLIMSAVKYRGNLTRIERLIDTSATQIGSDQSADVTNYNHDVAGNIVSATLSCCQLMTIDYGTTFSATGYAYPVRQTKGTAPTQLVTEATYNTNTGLVTSSKNENAQVTTYEYEADTLRPKKTIFPNEGYVLAEYSDKLVTTTNDLLPGFVRTTTTLDTNKTVQTYNYFNGAGQGIRSATQTPDGWSVSAVEFDKLGRSVKSYNPFYASTPTGAIPAGTKYTEVLGHDALGRTTSVQLQDNTIISTEYSDINTTPSGFNKTFVTITDQAGKKRRRVADSLGRIVRVDEPDLNGNLGAVNSPNQPTIYEYDSNDNLAKVTQSDGTVTQERLFKYDSLSRLTHEKHVEADATLNDAGVKVTSGGLWTKVLKYDSHGLLTESINSLGVKTNVGYDSLNRVSSITFTGETGYQTPAVNYTYDEERSGFYNRGQLTKITTAAVTGTQATPATEQVYDFDKMGRVVKHQQKIASQSYLLEYGYNLAGQLVSNKYPSGRIINTGYDANGRLSTVGETQRTYLSGVLFNSQTLPSQMSFGNGTNQSFGFNDRLQMTLQELKRDSEVLQKYNYGYGQIDINGNLDTTKNNGQLARIESYIGTNKQWTQKFKYDSIGRLSETEEKRGDTNALSYKQKFDFDRFGNLYRKSVSNPTTGQENPLPYTTIEDSDIDRDKNRFTSATGTTYNEAGQVIMDNKFRLMSFGYDANGRMVKASRENQPDALSVYDSLGNRVAQKVNDVWQFVIYDAFGNIVAEYGGMTSSGEGGIKYALSDWQGSVRAVLNNSGFVQSRTDYQSFGEEIQSGVGLRTATSGFDSGINTRRGYGSTENDDSTGLNHTWFRKYENGAGRWTSPDPYNGSINIDNPQSFNRFSYVENQPTNFVDPSGLQLVTRCQWWTLVYDGGPNDGEEVPGTERRLVCITYDDGRRGGGQMSVDFGGGILGGNLGSTTKNDPDKAKLDKFFKCFNDAKESISTQYNIAVDTIRRNTDEQIRNLTVGAVIAVGILIGVGIFTAGFGAALGGLATASTYSLALETLVNQEANNIRAQRLLANAKLKDAFKACKEKAGLP